MALPVVDFIHVEDYPARTVDLPEAMSTGDVTVRDLNRDPDSGAQSLVVTFAAGGEVAAGYWSCDLEFLMLEGSLTMGSASVERYGYQFVPAGVATGRTVVGDAGATALVFTSGPVLLTASAHDEPGAPRHRLIGPVHLADVPWEQPRTAGFPAGAGRKTLREDTETGGGFWVLGVLPHWTSAMTEWHAFTEENYILEGGIETAEGLMEVGSYLSHAAGPASVHGPMRSRRGSLLITRAQGPLETTYAPCPLPLPGVWR
ncbi:MAG: DUF4437 domain-containing protein [Knoellia sp.]